jgi:YgiT-type zinc finger domain-containing protein
MHQPCPICGGTMVFEERPDVITYAGRTNYVQSLGWWCTSCGEAIFDGTVLAKQQQVFLALKQAADTGR